MFEAIVTDPPSSGELRTRVAEMIQSGLTDGLLQLTVFTSQEVPAPESSDLKFRLAHTTHTNGIMQVTGPTPEGGSAVVRISADPTAQATATIVTP